jgi:Delta7-sterol 5-desaturase
MTIDDFIQFDNLRSIVVFSVVTFVAILFRYILVSGIFVLVFQVFLKNEFASRTVIQKLREPNQTWREIGWSALTSLIFTASMVVMVWMYMNDYTQIYTGWILADLIYIPLSIAAYMFIHEAYYYFLHRWMHRPGIYRYFHKIHHDSVVTSPWTAFSFHPLESVLQAAIIPLLLFFIPIHFGSLVFLLILMTISATINHLNIEIYPKWMATTGIGKWVIGATHHGHHHKYFNKNFGLYFTFFDRWLGTESEDFDEEFSQLTGRQLK